jgi:hypothetical protein
MCSAAAAKPLPRLPLKDPTLSLSHLTSHACRCCCGCCDARIYFADSVDSGVFTLDNLQGAPGSAKRKTRKGRGIAAGQGHQCGFGMRGQKSRGGRPVQNAHTLYCSTYTQRSQLNLPFFCILQSSSVCFKNHGALTMVLSFPLRFFFWCCRRGVALFWVSSRPGQGLKAGRPRCTAGCPSWWASRRARATRTRSTTWCTWRRSTAWPRALPWTTPRCSKPRPSPSPRYRGWGVLCADGCACFRSVVQGRGGVGMRKFGRTSGYLSGLRRAQRQREKLKKKTTTQGLGASPCPFNCVSSKCTHRFEVGVCVLCLFVLVCLRAR